MGQLDMWEHDCPVERHVMLIGKGQPCNWCGREESDENHEFGKLIDITREQKMKVVDRINPNHYKQGEIEVIDFILDQDFSYLEGNIIKYVSRYKYKNGLEDLKKAQWYLNKLVEETSGPKDAA